MVLGLIDGFMRVGEMSFGWWAAAIFLGSPLTLIPNWILLAMALAPQRLGVSV